MFFFTNYTFLSILVALAALMGLVLVNELTRRNKFVSIAVYIVLPILLTAFVWRAGDGSSSTGTWFAWVKTYSALAGVIGFMAIRYIPKLQNNKLPLLQYPRQLWAEGRLTHWMNSAQSGDLLKDFSQ
jgi:hypothetical protein